MSKRIVRSTIMQLYVTFPDQKIAKKIARALLKEKLVACANIFPAGVSIYEWQNKIETTKEVVVIFKTTKKKSSLAMERLLALHPYECPCVMSLQPVLGFKSYLQWVENSVSVR